MTVGFILSQVLGLVALVLVGISYFKQKKHEFLIFQTIANIFYAFAFLAQSVYMGCVLAFIAIFRAFIFYLYEKHEKTIPLLLAILFVVLYFVLGIVLFEAWYDFMPPLCYILCTIAFYIKNIKVTRYVMLFPNLCMGLYNVFVATYASALLDFVEMVAITCAIIKYKNGHTGIM